MKEILNLIVLIFVLCYPIDAQKVKNSDSQPTRLGLKGEVKSLVTKNFHVFEDSGNVCKKRFYTEDDDSVFYDINGYLSKFHHFDFNGKIVGYGFFLYDSMFYRTEEKIYNDKGIMIRHTTNKNTYDNSGKITGTSTISTNEKKESRSSQIDYKYDEKGRRIEMIFSRNNKYVYKYNANNKMIEESLISPIGKIISRDVYDYDKNGNRILWDHYYSDGRLVSKIIEKYDDRNNPIYFETWNISDGKLLLETTSKRTYDFNNNLLEERSFGPNGEFDGRIIYKYKYDEHQNWIERINYSDENKPVIILERKIEYY